MAISAYVIPYTRGIIDMFLGPSYMNAWLPLSLMFFYPVHQSMGQITGTMLFSMGKTKAASYIGLFFMLISILIAYIVLAPKSAVVPGFQLGATGLALKMVVCQIIAVNISAYFVARYINISFDWIHQIMVLCLLPIGILVKLFSEFLLKLVSIKVTLISSIIPSSIIYFIFISIILFCWPSLAGLNKKQINNWIHIIKDNIK